MTTKRETTLYFQQGTSDKVYQAQIIEQGTGFTVNFQYGRRDSTLTAGTKTAEPVAFEEAEKIFDRLVKEKTAKGYTPGETGTPYASTADADRVTDLAVQLLNEADEDTLNDLLQDPDFVIQEKKDGKRMLLWFTDHDDPEKAVRAVNRRGLVCGAPETLTRDFLKAAINEGVKSLIIDGESIGERFYAFDILEYDGNDIRQDPYYLRHRRLASLHFYDQITVVLFSEGYGGGLI